jgi:ribosomal protein L1
MAKLTKKAKRGCFKIDKTKIFFKDAALIKVVAKFDESVDIAVRLGVDQEKRIKW